MTKTTKVYTRWVAYELRKKGLKITAVEPNPNKPYLDVYVFEDTPQFQSIFSEVMTNCDNRKKDTTHGAVSKPKDYKN